MNVKTQRIFSWQLAQKLVGNHNPTRNNLKKLKRDAQKYTVIIDFETNRPTTSRRRHSFLSIMMPYRFTSTRYQRISIFQHCISYFEDTFHLFFMVIGLWYTVMRPVNTFEEACLVTWPENLPLHDAERP